MVPRLELKTEERFKKSGIELMQGSSMRMGMVEVSPMNRDSPRNVGLVGIQRLQSTGSKLHQTETISR